MFSLAHFIWLGCIALAIATALVAVKKLKPSNETVQRVVCVVLVLTKLFHLSLSMKESEMGGMVLEQNQLSFQLCSIMIYLTVLITVVKNEKFVKTIKSFMVPCMLIGAAMALLIPTAGVDPTAPRVWEYMLAHCTLVFYGAYLMAVERVDLSLRSYLTNLKLLALLVVVAFMMNSILEAYDTNFMFLREPPMEGLPILNLDHGWHIYFVTLALIACTLVLLVHLPFVISDFRKKLGKEKKKITSEN